jgi:hypothetical protein
MRKNDGSGDRTLLELWRCPAGAGEPVGCLTTTYTFAPELFDERCLSLFLDIDSDPDRESLPFLLEREFALGTAYAGVLVDRRSAGVAHSLRWDILPVRIPGGKQHAKVSLLAWERCVRLIVTSANLTNDGYRSNFEVAAAIDRRARKGIAQSYSMQSPSCARSSSSFPPRRQRSTLLWRARATFSPK